MLYKTLSALSIKGTRVERGEVIDVDPAYAASIGSDYLTPLDLKAPVETEPQAEVSLEDLTKVELAELCDKAGLSTKGTKADLIERIKLYQSNLTDHA